MKKGITILYWALTILPFLISIAVIPILPDQIPAHYDINGEVDRWGSKWETLILPAISLVVCSFFYPFMMMQLKDQQHKGNVMAMNITLLLLPTVFFVVFLFLTITSLQGVEDISKFPIMQVFCSVIALFFAALGFVLPNVKSNQLFGIRTTWTLKNEEVWEKTHKFSGKLFIVGGICIAVICLLVSELISFIIFMVGLLLLSVLSIVYSYKVYKQVVNK